MYNTPITEQLSDELLFLYNTGKCYRAYRTWGAHITEQKLDNGKSVNGIQFTVWVPDVKSVRIIGDWNSWDGNDYLQPVRNSGMFTGFVPSAKVGDKYKLDIEIPDGKHLIKADPFAFSSELRPDTASVITDLIYEWHDAEWIKNRSNENRSKLPLNIYEVHLGSWMRHPYEDGFYSYRELAERLIPYVKDMGYTHLELLPVMEHPLDASWGYQVTGYYSATSRYGNPADLKHFIDQCHNEGLGVILDWVPGHFCPDEHGLCNFNGTMLYEKEVHPEWGTYKFDFGRGQVRSFLLSNAVFWLDEFHVDGLRVDGVSSMLYMNFGISNEKQKKYNRHGGEGDLEAIEFLREFNHIVGSEFPGVFTAAEESTSWPMVTMPPSDGGLGFHFKWNMGWMNDTLEYMSCDFPARKDNHNKLTFAMTYAHSENFILPLSHDEVVHGKKSLIGRMPGDIWRQFAGLRALAVYQMTHPGKKLNFMGHEIAPFIEWREYEELEWFMLKYDNHSLYRKFTKDINNLYKEHPALWARDCSTDGFMWIDPDNCEQSILSYMRFGDKVDIDNESCEKLVIVLNMGVQYFEKYRIGVQEPGIYEELLNSDNTIYGGSGKINASPVKAEKIPMHGLPYSIEINMPVLGGTVLIKK